MRKTVKQTRELVAEGKAAEAIQLLPTIYKTLDKAAKKGVIKKNTADRKKSRLTELLQPQNK